MYSGPALTSKNLCIFLADNMLDVCLHFQEVIFVESMAFCSALVGTLYVQDTCLSLRTLQ